jgi:hypothetical protein
VASAIPRSKNYGHSTLFTHLVQVLQNRLENAEDNRKNLTSSSGWLPLPSFSLGGLFGSSSSSSKREVTPPPEMKTFQPTTTLSTTTSVASPPVVASVVPLTTVRPEPVKMPEPVRQQEVSPSPPKKPDPKPEPEPEKRPVKKTSASGGFASSLWNLLPFPKPTGTVVDLGEGNDFFYDKDLKIWRKHGEDVNPNVMQSLGPPPTIDPFALGQPPSGGPPAGPSHTINPEPPSTLPPVTPIPTTVPELSSSSSSMFTPGPSAPPVFSAPSGSRRRYVDAFSSNVVSNSSKLSVVDQGLPNTAFLSQDIKMMTPSFVPLPLPLEPAPELLSEEAQDPSAQGEPNTPPPS